TDETFALHSTQFPVTLPPKKYVFTINLAAHLAWIAGGCLGYSASSLLTDLKPFGLDYALAAMFIGLLVLQLKDFRKVGTAILAGIAAVFFHLIGLKTGAVIFATMMAATIGMVWELWKKN
ncbi:MAG: branched-chain amino acid ABC transporter permease, partial [bacterium]|nr:branched-chain amino acid ABC transporter permease [bacterium]